MRELAPKQLEFMIIFGNGQAFVLITGWKLWDKGIRMLRGQTNSVPLKQSKRAKAHRNIENTLISAFGKTKVWVLAS